MSIKETRHPPHCIDLAIVPFSMKIHKKLLDTINKHIIEEYGKEYEIPENHHVLIIDMGEST
jgi:hypothetical protein